MDKKVLKNELIRYEQNLLKNIKLIKNSDKIFSDFFNIYHFLNEVKENIKISREEAKIFASALSESNFINVFYNFYSEINSFKDKIEDIKLKLKEVYTLLEEYKSYKTYKIKDRRKIFSFFSQFLDGYADSYLFKPEFIGEVKYDDFYEITKAVKDGPYLRISYNYLPKAINLAYSKKMKNFIIEAHGLKMLFKKDYEILITADSDFLKKIDRAAKESNVEIL